MRKSISIVIALLLLISSFTGCGTNSATTNSATTNSADKSATVPDNTEKTTIQLILPSNVQEFPSGVTQDDNFIVDYWREKTGYEFDIYVMPNEATGETKLKLMFNSGEVKGLAFSREPQNVGLYASSNLTQPLDDFMADSTFFQQFADSQVLGKYNNKQYAAVIPSDGIYIQSTEYLIRKDILTKNGINQQPKTFDEFNTVLKVLKSANTVPLALYGAPNGTSAGVLNNSFSVIQAFYGIQNEFSIRDGKVVFNKIQPEAKEYLKYVQQLYKDGYLPKDFITLNEKTTTEMYLSKKAGIIGFTSPWGSKTVIDKSEELNLDTKILDYPSGVNGQPSYGANVYGPLALVAFVSNQCSYTKDAIKFLDFLIKPETSLITNFGKEGEHYTLKDGKAIPTAKATEISWGVYFRNIFLPEDWYYVYGVGAGWAEYYYPCERSTKDSNDPDPVKFMPRESKYESSTKDLNTKVVEQYYSKVVMGQESLDNFDQFVTQWLEGGGQETLDYYNKLYTDLGSPKFELKSYLPNPHTDYTGKYLFDGIE